MAPPDPRRNRKLARRPESTPLALAKLLGVFVVIALASEGITMLVDSWLTDRAPTGSGKDLVPFQSGFLQDPLIYVTLDASTVGTRIASRALFFVVIGFFFLLLAGQLVSEERLGRVHLVGLVVIAVMALGVGPYLSVYYPLELTVIDGKSKRLIMTERESFLYAGVKPTAHLKKMITFADLRGFTVRYVDPSDDNSGRSFVELYAFKSPPRRPPGSKLPPARPQPTLVGRALVRGGLLDLPKYLRDKTKDKAKALASARRAAAYLTQVALTEGRK